MDIYLLPKQQYCDSEKGSSCDALVLGQLLRELKGRDLYPFPSSPYHGLSFDDMEARITNMSLTSACEEFNIRPRFGARRCGVKLLLENALKKERLSLGGLDLPAST